MVDAVYSPLFTRAVFGPLDGERLAAEAGLLGVTRPLFLTSGRRVPWLKALASAARLPTGAVFDSAAMHTPIEVTVAALAYATEAGADGIVTIGGGSTIGLGKALAVRTDWPQIVVPTTYSGSEMTNIVGETKGGEKVTQRSQSIQPECVIYDVDLFLDLPARIATLSGLNALAHAVEGLYATDRNPVISVLAVEAARLIATNLPGIVLGSTDQAAQEAMMLGAHLAGTALGSVAMSLHHKLCHILGGAHALPHAETHSVLLPYVVAYNEATAKKQLAPLAEFFPGTSIAHGLQRFAHSLGAPRSLRSLGLEEASIRQIAREATTNAYSNPRPLEENAIKLLLQDAFIGRDIG